MIYPFVNGKRQFNLQYRKYDRKYDSYLFLVKEFLALLCYFILKPYWDHKKLWLVGEKYCTMAQDNGFISSGTVWNRYRKNNEKDPLCNR